MPSASAHSLGALRLLEACTAVSYCSQVAASWPALARKRGSWELTIIVRDSARDVVECVMDLFSVRHVRLTKLRATNTGPRLYVSAQRGPYLGNAPYPLLFGAQRNAEFDQGGRAVQRITTGSEPSHQGPRNRTRWRVASARAHTVAPDRTWPSHAPYAAPVLRNSPCGQDGGRIHQEG